MDKHKKLVTLYVALVLSWISLYLLLFHAQFGSPIRAEVWVREVYIVKSHISDRTPGPRIVIISGSNALFGMDSHLMEKRLGCRTINLSLHAGLPLEYLFTRNQRNLKSGDVVIMPLEYEYFIWGQPYTDWFINQVVAWDPDYYWDLGLVNKYRFIVAFSPARVVGHLVRKATRKRRPLVSEKSVIARVESNWESGRYTQDPIYSSDNIDRRGDVVNRGTRTGNTGEGYRIDRADFELSAYAEKQLSDFATYCSKRGIALFVTWPPAPRSQGMDLTSPIVKANVQKIADFLRWHGVAVIGSPTDFLFDPRFFSDKYHLTQQGAKLRTERLIALLRKEPFFLSCLQKRSIRLPPEQSSAGVAP